MTFISVLNSFGFKKVPWGKCPQGFEKANYPCYSKPDKNIWAEVYKSDKPPYMWIIGKGIKGTGIGGGIFFYDPAMLNKLLKQLE